MAHTSFGKILVEIISACDLAKPIDGLVEVHSTGGFQFRWLDPFMHEQTSLATRHVVDSQNPIWQASIELIVVAEGPEMRNDSGLLFKLFDHNSLTPNTLIGTCLVPYHSMKSNRLEQPTPFRLVAPNSTDNVGQITLKFNYVGEVKRGLNPLEELAEFPAGTYQFKTFSSNAARRQEDDVRVANTAARDWLNAVRDRITLIKLEQENTTAGAQLTVWFRML